MIAPGAAGCKLASCNNAVVAGTNHPRRSLHRDFFLGVTALCAASLLLRASAAPAGAVLNIETKMAPPAWAVLERRVLEASTPALTEFYKKYYDDRGYVQCVLRWGADDGPDDAFENFAGWPELHALGGSDEVLRLYRQGVDGMI